MADVKNNLQVNNGSAQSEFGMSKAEAETCNGIVQFAGRDPKNETPVSFCIVYYKESSAIDLTKYNDLPTGTIVIDTQAFKIHMKTAAATWKSSAAMS